MIALRKLFQVFGRGTLEFLDPDNRKVLAYLREYDDDDGALETVLCVANLSRFAQPVSLDLAEFAGMVPVEMLGYVPFPTIDRAALCAHARAVLLPLARTPARARSTRARPGAPKTNRSSASSPQGIDGLSTAPGLSPAATTPPHLSAAPTLVRREVANHQIRHASSTPPNSPASTPSSSSFELTYTTTTTRRLSTRPRHLHRRSSRDHPSLRPRQPSSPPSPPLTAPQSFTTPSRAKTSVRPSSISSKPMANFAHATATRWPPQQRLRDKPRHRARSPRAPAPPNNPTPPSSTTTSSS